MAYCTNADILVDFPGVSFTAGRVTTANIDDFITDADALINSYLAGRYATPVAGTESLKVLKLYSRTLVSDKIKGILEVKQATNQGANQNIRSGLTTKDVLKLLEAYRDGDMQLSDAGLLLEDGGIASFNVKKAIAPEFKKSEKQW